MTSKTISNGILRAVGIILGIALLGLFIYKIQSVIVYITIAGIVALLGRPIVVFLKTKLKFPDTLAVVVTITLFLIFVFGFHLSSFLAFFESPKRVSTSKGLKYSLSHSIMQLAFLSKHFDFAPLPFQ